MILGKTARSKFVSYNIIYIKMNLGCTCFRYSARSGSSKERAIYSNEFRSLIIEAGQHIIEGISHIAGATSDETGEIITL